MEPMQASRAFSDRYELTHLIARGGMAEVYRARDRLLDRPVALKVLFPELSVDRTFVERFRREAQAAANLSHPNIVPVFDWGEDDGTYFIVMEFVDGDPLSAILRNSGPIEPVRAAEIAAQVAGALDYAHRRGVIHRDVKPGNVLITNDGDVKVTDFGIARAVNTEESLTQTGAVMGTATYFSPEQAEGHGVDARSDIYSLAVVLFEMLCGRPPFVGDSPVAVASKHVRDVAPLPRELNPAVPVALENIVMMAMAKSPDQRYATAEEFRLDLLRFTQGRSVEATPAAVTSVMAGVGQTSTMSPVGGTQAIPAVEREQATDQEAHRRRVRRLALLLLLLIVILGVIIYFLGQSLGYWGKASVTVPNLTGQTAAAARATLQRDGLTPAIKTVSSNQAVGTVIRTQPPGGSSISKGQTVTLYVSGGAKQVTVPDVTGQQLNAAEANLRSHNLQFSVNHEQNAAAVNTVVSQNPSGGSTASANSVVTLTVSSGETTVAIPDVSGDTAAQAGSALASAGLAVGDTTNQYSDSTQSGLVIATDPTAGTVVAKGSTVNLIVSAGPAPTTTTTTTSPPSTTTTTTTLPPSTTTPTNTPSTPTTPTNTPSTPTTPTTRTPH